MPDLTIDDINTQFDALQAAAVKAFADGSQYVTDLKAQVAAGSAVTPAQLDALGAKMTAFSSLVSTFDINNTEPPATVPPVPPAAAASKH